jgi:hypothetical protein
MAEINRKEKDEDDLLSALNLDQPVSIPGSGSHPCPVCERGTLDYDHFLNLVCSNCGYVEASCFT